jgi:hypothetical protein
MGEFCAVFFLLSLLFAYKRHTIIKKTIRALLLLALLREAQRGLWQNKAQDMKNYDICNTPLFMNFSTEWQLITKAGDWASDGRIQRVLPPDKECRQR